MLRSDLAELKPHVIGPVSRTKQILLYDVNNRHFENGLKKKIEEAEKSLMPAAPAQAGIQRH